MKSTLRRTCLPALAACLTLVAPLSGADSPTPAVAPVAPAVAPAAAPAAAPTPKVTPLQLPKALEGVVTLEEFTSLVKFQQGLRENPEIVALNQQIRGKMNEMIELQKQAQAVQQKELEAHPDIKAISDKIKAHRPKPPALPVAGPKPPMPATGPVTGAATPPVPAPTTAPK
jgi:hypothetical protein